MTEQDVADEEGSVQEGPDQAGGIARPLHVDQDDDAEDGERQGREVAPGAQTVEGDADGAHELDRRDKADGQFNALFGVECLELFRNGKRIQKNLCPTKKSLVS